VPKGDESVRQSSYVVYSNAGHSTKQTGSLLLAKMLNWSRPNSWTFSSN